jgi:hypothetical protein
VNRILALFVLITCISAQAETLKLKDYACDTQLKTILNQWKVSDQSDWKKQPADSSMHAYKVHGETFAEWVTISTPTQSQTEVNHYLPDGTTMTVTLNTKKCDEQNWVSTAAPKKSKLDVFTDDDLKVTLEETKNGILYMWSPNMSLSKMGIKNIKAAAKDLGLPVKLIMDAFADQRFAKLFAQEQKLQDSDLKRMKSRELASNGATLHYPAVIVYKDGKICHGSQNGYRTQEKYRQIITEMYGRCKQ